MLSSRLRVPIASTHSCAHTLRPLHGEAAHGCRRLGARPPSGLDARAGRGFPVAAHPLRERAPTVPPLCFGTCAAVRAQTRRLASRRSCTAAMPWILGPWLPSAKMGAGTVAFPVASMTTRSRGPVAVAAGTTGMRRTAVFVPSTAASGAMVRPLTSRCTGPSAVPILSSAIHRRLLGICLREVRGVRRIADAHLADEQSPFVDAVARVRSRATPSTGPAQASPTTARSTSVTSATWRRDR